jgi:hypothetical protein
MSAVALVDLKSRAPARLQSSDVTTQSEGTLHHAAEPRRWPTGWWSTLRRVVGRPQRHITRPLPLCSRGLLHGALAQAAPSHAVHARRDENHTRAVGVEAPHSH